MYIKVSYKERDIAEVNIIHGNRVALLSICNGNKTRTKQKEEEEEETANARSHTRLQLLSLGSLQTFGSLLTRPCASKHIGPREREKKENGQETLAILSIHIRVKPSFISFESFMLLRAVYFFFCGTHCWPSFRSWICRYTLETTRLSRQQTT